MALAGRRCQDDRLRFLPSGVQSKQGTQSASHQAGRQVLMSYTEFLACPELAHFIENRCNDSLGQITCWKQRRSAREFLFRSGNIHRSNGLNEPLAHSTVRIGWRNRWMRPGDHLIQLAFRKSGCLTDAMSSVDRLSEPPEAQDIRVGVEAGAAIASHRPYGAVATFPNPNHVHRESRELRNPANQVFRRD